ncbi:MAG: peptide chain release factor N(5)-glutamine methyltransferase [Candidatus Eremiobacteraeota bacterium]|nr:peptide chain release factor N(5)-glutamine methyltransferase [Candidatus Eremiobacteraeota bacterium]
MAPSLRAIGSSTVGDALRRGISVLSESSEEARTDALILLAHVIGRSREWIVAHGEASVSEADFSLFIDLWERRRGGEPVAYITGSAWFYGREFFVNGSVLIPRPESEHLVEEAVAFIREGGNGTLKVLDVGTGSGAIACSVAAETNALVDATDLSPGAIAVARENARLLEVAARCRFFGGNFVDPVLGRRYDIVVANLPYVPTDDLAVAPDSTSFEPRVALDGGADGLEVYRQLLPKLPALLNEKPMVLLEAAPPTIAKLRELAQAALPGFAISVGHDYAGLARYLKAQRNKT